MTHPVRQTFAEDCLGVIKETPLYEHSAQVQICLLILYNYFTIERYRDQLLVRFLALRNLEPRISELTEAYWAVREKRKELVQGFVQTIEENAAKGYEEKKSYSHQDWTGTEVICTLG